MFYEDLVADSALYLRRLFDFLGADPSFVVDTSRRHNKGLVKRDTALARLLYANFPRRQWLRRKLSDSAKTFVCNKLTKSTHASAAPLSNDMRVRLVDRFRDDVRQLQPLVDRDLSSWIQ